MRRPTAAVLMILAAAAGAVAATPDPAADRLATALRERLTDLRALDLAQAADEIALLAPDEAAEQLRDWAVLATVGQLDLGGPGIDWFRLVGGLPPPLRADEAAGARPLPHGPGRLAVIGPGDWLALVPAAGRLGTGPARYRLDVACRLLDERRMLDGAMPERVHIVAYEADAAAKPPRVALAYAATVPARAFESPTTGFVTAAVRDVEGLSVFLRQADDLLEVRGDGDGLIHLAGRRYGAGRYAREFRRVDAADLATIRRSQGERPGREGRSASNLGFSLDPWLDPKPLAAALRKLAATSGGASGADVMGVASRLERLVPFPVPDSPDGDGTGLFALAESAGGRPGRALAELVASHTAQVPLYIGTTRGTEVGMTFYYTDLMAKLFAMGAVVGEKGRVEELDPPDLGGAPLRPVLAAPLAAFHRAEALRLGHSRLWWAPRAAGFVRLHDGAIRFAPVATTLFMKSKSSQTAREVDASLENQAFCDAWNRAYSAAADAHPEFHRLNQFMKWSVVFKAAESAPEDPWAFLDDVPAGPARAFPAWYAEGRASGRLAGPERLPFVAMTPEALAPIRSKDYPDGPSRFRYLKGGIDTATQDQVEGRTAAVGSTTRGAPPDAKVAALPPGGGDGVPLEWGGTLRPSGDRGVVLDGVPRPPDRSPALGGGDARRAEPSVTVHTDVAPSEGAGGLTLDVIDGDRGRPEAATTFTAGPATSRGIPVRIRRRGRSADRGFLERVARGMDVEPDRLRSTPDGRLFLRTGEGDDPRWREMVAGNDPAAPGLKLGDPGSSLWYRLVDRGPGEIPGAAPGTLEGPASPRYAVAEAGPGAAPHVGRAWIAPPARSEVRSRIRGEECRLAVTDSGAVVASGARGRELLAQLNREDVARLGNWLRDGGRRGRGGLRLDGPGVVLTRDGRGGVAVRPVGEADRAALARAAETGPAAVELHGDGFTVTRPDGLRLDVTSAYADVQRGAAVDPAVRGFFDEGRVVLDVSRLDPAQIEALTQQTSALGAAVVVWTGERGGNQRLRELTATRYAVEARGDPSVLKLRGHGDLLRELHGDIFGEGLRIEGPDGSAVRIVVGHRDAAGTFFDDLSRKAGEYENANVWLVVCNLDPSQTLQVSRLLLNHGAASVTFTLAAMDVRAANAALAYLRNHREMVGEVTPDVLGRTMYLRTRDVLDRALDADDPAAAALLIEAFGERAAKRLFIRNGSESEIDRRAVKAIRDAADVDGLGMVPCVDRSEPPRGTLAA